LLAQRTQAVQAWQRVCCALESGDGQPGYATARTVKQRRAMPEQQAHTATASSKAVRHSAQHRQSVEQQGEVELDDARW